MDECYYPTQGLQQRAAARPQINSLQPHFMQAQGSMAPRERYRATQYDHPMYDAVEDDDYGRSARLDSFDDRTLPQQYNDHQYQSLQGRGRLSLAPTASRLFGGEVIQQELPPPRPQQMYQITHGDEDQHFSPADAIRGSFDHFAYNAAQPFETSSDVTFGTSSSPALNAGKRRSRPYDLGASQQSSRPQPFELIPDRRLADDGGNAQYQGEINARPSRPSQRDVGRPFKQVTRSKSPTNTISLSQALPTVQGIILVPVSVLPDRLRTVFPFPNFNAVQSKCFDQVFKSDNNFVLSSPTGSGKTVIMELAICRAVASNSTGQYKVVYQAPTKALCSERHRDWDRKFTQIGLKCAELTGDTDAAELSNVQSANIIVTTPEKWDSITRKWKDHEKLMGLIKLFLIDEIHILNDSRGAVLEAVVSRMKSVGTNVRFVALSATVPNSHDVAAWLGKSFSKPYLSASNERFGEDFRPVKLRKHVCGYAGYNDNDFAFEKMLDAKLPEVITKYSEQRPMMIFCATRSSCLRTAQLIAKWWSSRRDRDHLWNPPSQALHIQGKENRDLVDSGVAFHHAGLDQEDRHKVEQGFLKGDINVICCTSTLAVGVNLPCHLVIIKNTMAWTNGCMKEYSDLDMMQMLGRAGRPQFDNSAVAVIMTRQTKVRRYETLVTSEEVLESKLHLNLIDHMNAEIGLGTIRDLDTARKWLTGTFLYVRLQQNPGLYKLEASDGGQDVQELVDDICFRDITLLREHNLVSGDEYFRCTEFGHAMARYYVQFETMKIFMGLQAKSALSEILSAVAQAVEFSDIRFRQGEKGLYKKLNKSPSIRFPIPTNLDLSAQKVSLIVQSVLGHTDMAWEGDMAKHRAQYRQEVVRIFKSINSLVRCIIDCQICLGDSVSIQSALMLERCLGSKAWDDTPLQMVQVPDIGVVSARKLVNAGICSIEDLESTDARRIETIVGKNPPFGLKIIDTLRSYPKLRVSLHVQQSSVTKTAEGVKVQVHADIGFMNEKPPVHFGKKPVYVCMLAETSDGRKIHFARTNGYKLGVGQMLTFSALLTSSEQRINCYLMCEGIGENIFFLEDPADLHEAGSMRDATVAPDIASSMFPAQKSTVIEPMPIHRSNTSRRRIESAPIQRKRSVASEDFGDADLDDDAFVKASCDDLDFDHIDNFERPLDVITRKSTTKNKPATDKGNSTAPAAVDEDVNGIPPVQLPNGRWLCSHKCKDKTSCKHYCCKYGMEKPSKKVVPKPVPTDEHHDTPTPENFSQRNNKAQAKLQPQASKRKSCLAPVEELDLTQEEKKRKTEYAISGPRDYRDLHSLHKNVQNQDLPVSLHSVMNKKPAYCYGGGGEHELSFLSQSISARPKTSSEYGDLQLDDFPTEASTYQYEPTGSDNLASLPLSKKTPAASRDSDTFDDDDSMLGEAIVGLADSQDLQWAKVMGATSRPKHRAREDIDVADNLIDAELFTGTGFTAGQDASSDLPKEVTRTTGHHGRHTQPARARAPFLEATSSPEQSRHFRQATSMLQDRVVCESQQGRAAPPPQPGHATKDMTEEYETEEEDECSDLLNMLDLPLQADNKDNKDNNDRLASAHPPARVEPAAQSVEIKQEKAKQSSEDGGDLQPWLLQEFGDIVELVDE